MWLANVLDGHEKLPPRPPLSAMFRSLIGGGLSMMVLLLLSKYTNNQWIMAPFGASSVLLYAAAQSPLAQPRNVIGGHFISALTGLCVLKLLGVNVWSIALAVGSAIVLMQYFQCVHPPAGANPLVILLTASQIHYGWDFLLFPVLSGSVALLFIAYVVNNLWTTQSWPVYALALRNSKK